MEEATDVSNLSNDVGRWTAALEFYGQQQQAAEGGGGAGRSSGRVNIKLVIDRSGSMEGTKLTSSKLGLCAVISSLHDDDKVDICCFSNYNTSITGGFVSVASIRATLPSLLVNVEADGGTAAFDAVIEALKSLRQFTRSSSTTTTAAAGAGGSAGAGGGGGFCAGL